MISMDDTASGQPAEQEGSCVFPTSFAQQRLWFFDQFEPGSALYNMPGSLRLRGPTDVAAFTRSLNEIVRRHEALRTTFRSADGQPVQVIAPSLHIEIPVVDLRDLDETERKAKAQRLSEEEARQPFDLARGPLLRAKLLWLAEADHVLLLTMHHIVSDGWSMGVFFKELSALYTAFQAGRASPLPELPIQYADFAVWQRELLQGRVLEEHLEHWRRHLRGAPALLELPTDRPRPPVQGFSGSVHEFRLPLSLQQAVQALSQQEGVTPFMTLLSAFSVLLHRYARQPDLVIGTPLANRTRAELEGLIGFFVNMLALRLDLGGGPSFRALLRRVRGVTLGAYAHQDLPFERLVEELSPERNLRHNPVFQVAFVLQNLPGVEAGEAEGEAPSDTVPPVGPGAAKFDLTLDMTESPQGLLGMFEYNTDLFDAGTIERMAGHLGVLLSSAAEHPDQRITELPLLTAEEQHRLLREWNDTAAGYSRDACIHELFEAQAEATPEAPALLFEGRELRYRELNTRANRLAHQLRAREVGPGTFVGICVERSPEMVVAILGVLKAGGAYVPLDPALPRDRLAFIVEDAHIGLLLTQDRFVACLPEDGTAMLCLDAGEGELAGGEARNPSRLASAEDLAYVIYTSGSTGRPKGVLATHRNAVNRFSWMWRRYPFAPGEICCQKTTLSFVDSVWEIFGPLLRGVPSVLLPHALVQDVPRFVRELANGRVSRLVLVPSLLRAMLDVFPDLATRLPDLLHWTSSGETLPEELYARFLRAMPGCVLLNLYGSSEIAADATCFEAREGSASPRSSIGRPIANTSVYVLDACQRPVPIGVPGELYVGGDGVARGYLNRPELTAERFVPDPFSGTPGARMFRTGDLARWLADGDIEYLGRLDDQVKIRGVRIELEEVRVALGQHPSVREAVVVAREDTPGENRLVAYLVGSGRDHVPTSELRSFLLGRLPGYMVPSAFVPLEAIPLMPNGKVDRRALPAPGPPERDEAYTAPRNAIEEELATIWSSVLRIERIGVHSSFFELGGHSLMATRVASRILKAFQVEVPLYRLFEAPTIAELALIIIQISIEQESTRDADRMLDEVERLSPEEARALLEQERSGD